MMSVPVRLAARVAVATLLLAAPSRSTLTAQGTAPADVAAKMTGRWKLNESLSPGLSNAPGRGRAGGPGRGALFAMAAPAAAFQRGGRGGGGGGGGGAGDASSPIMSSEAAAQAALDVVQQVPNEVTITASADSVEFIEPRGSLVFKIDGKNGTVEVPGGSIKVKSRWDKGSLRQEFSSTQRMVKRAWSVDESGRLVLTQHVESVAMTTKEVRAVFDRQ